MRSQDTREKTTAGTRREEVMVTSVNFINMCISSQLLQNQHLIGFDLVLSVIAIDFYFIIVIHFNLCIFLWRGRI